TRPRSENTFSCAFSRTEQVLNKMMSASSGVLTSSAPSACRRTSTILSESYSFIWQPKVRIYTFLPLLSWAASCCAAEAAPPSEDSASSSPDSLCAGGLEGSEGSSGRIRPGGRGGATGEGAGVPCEGRLILISCMSNGRDGCSSRGRYEFGNNYCTCP